MSGQYIVRFDLLPRVGSSEAAQTRPGARAQGVESAKSVSLCHGRVTLLQPAERGASQECGARLVAGSSTIMGKRTPQVSKGQRKSARVTVSHVGQCTSDAGRASEAASRAGPRRCWETHGASSGMGAGAEG